MPSRLFAMHFFTGIVEYDSILYQTEPNEQPETLKKRN